MIIEDQAMFRGMVLQLCRTHFRCERLAAATTAGEGLALCAEVRPDVILLDLELPDAFAADLLEQILATSPDSKIIVLSSHTEDYPLHRCLRANVAGFVDKNNEPPEVVVEAVRTVMEGRTFFTSTASRMKAALRADPVAFNKLLTDREQELLALMGRGMTNEQIAAEVGISPKTVNNHRWTIMNKLGLHSAPELMRYAAEKGFPKVRAVLPR